MIPLTLAADTPPEPMEDIDVSAISPETSCMTDAQDSRTQRYLQVRRCPWCYKRCTRIVGRYSLCSGCDASIRGPLAGRCAATACDRPLRDANEYFCSNCYSDHGYVHLRCLLFKFALKHNPDLRTIVEQDEKRALKRSRAKQNAAPIGLLLRGCINNDRDSTLSVALDEKGDWVFQGRSTQMKKGVADFWLTRGVFTKMEQMDAWKHLQKSVALVPEKDEGKEEPDPKRVKLVSLDKE